MVCILLWKNSQQNGFSSRPTERATCRMSLLTPLPPAGLYERSRYIMECIVMCPGLRGLLNMPVAESAGGSFCDKPNALDPRSPLLADGQVVPQLIW